MPQPPRSPDFEKVFLKEKEKEEARIEGCIQSAVEAAVTAKDSKRQSRAAAEETDEDGKAKRCCFRTSKRSKKTKSRTGLWEKQKEIYEKSHPAWRMKDVFIEPTAGIVIANLLDALAPQCDERMEIAFVRALAQVSPECIASALERRGTLLSIANVIQATAQRACSTGTMAGADLNDKFCTSDSKSYKMAFGTTEDFQAGLEARIGSPNPKILPSIFQEHCSRCDSEREWTTGNYGISTKPKKEFFLVAMEVIRQCQSKEGNQYPEKWHRAAKFLQANLGPPSEVPDIWPAETKNAHLGRKPQEQKFLEELFHINEELRGIGEHELTIEEGMMLRLYTGPLFEKYNAVPRGFTLNGKANEHLEKEFRRLCCTEDGEENRYCSSIHVLNSSVIKLSQLTKLEPGAAVFRGVSSGILPRAFWEEDHRGCKGGAELGFMSTTRDESTATRYAGESEIKMVMKFETGAIDRGAEMERLSQYPQEKEILFPPLAFLQVLETKAEGGILIVHTRVNVNLRSPTIEEVIAKRFQILKLMSESNTMEVKELVRSSSWKRLLPEDFLACGAQLQKAFTKVVESEVSAILHSEAIHYNEDSAFLSAVQQLVHAANEVRLQKSSLLRRAASMLPKSERLVEIADEREAMEVTKQSCSFSFSADFAGMGQLWLFRVLGLQKAQDGLYYPMNGKDSDYRSFLLAKKSVASKGVELPQGLSLLSANGRRDLEVWAQEVQEAWRTGLEMTLNLVFCAPRSSEDFSKALLLKLEAGEPVQSLARYLLSNSGQQELDLDSACLNDAEGQRLCQALAQTAGRLDLELLILSHNDLRSAFAKSLAEALQKGCLPRLELLQLFDNTELGGNLDAMRALLSAVAEHCGALEVV